MNLQFSIISFVSVVLTLAEVSGAVSRPRIQDNLRPQRIPPQDALLNLKAIPFKIVYETYRTAPDPDSGGRSAPAGPERQDDRGNWELYMINADGSNPVNLTNTPDVDEMYPHVSPDGTKICFVADEGPGDEKVRNVYYMNIDGTERVKVARNAREPCWSFDSKSIAYLEGEYERYTTREYATAELMIYDLETGLHRPHPNKELHHLYAICWSPCGKWFAAAVHGGMGYSDTILAFEANGNRVFDLGRWGVKGCRPDLSCDGTKMTWGETDWNLRLGDIDLTGYEPRVTNTRDIVRCSRRYKIYHVDLSPDARYIAFSYGPSSGGQQAGGMARGWDICVSDLSAGNDWRQLTWVKVTTDGNHNKEPDWVPTARTRDETATVKPPNN
jgi:Tol biopolymer transport system component